MLDLFDLGTGLERAAPVRTLFSPWESPWIVGGSRYDFDSNPFFLIVVEYRIRTSKVKNTVAFLIPKSQ